MDKLKEFKDFLKKDNPYAINILINLIDVEMEKASGEYLENLKDLAQKFLKVGM